MLIRPIHTEGYGRDADIAGIKALCKERSYMGRDICEVFNYGALWSELIIGAYEKFAPEFIWVAEEIGGSEILGYLTGALDDDFYASQEQYLSETVSRLQQQSLMGFSSNPLQFWGKAFTLVSSLNLRTMEFLHYLRAVAPKEVPKRPNTPHFNVFTRVDGEGIARALIKAFLQELRSRSVPSYHINALFLAEEKERKALEAKGFRVRSLDFFTPPYSLYDSMPTRIFHPHDVMIGVFERDVPG